MRFARYLSWREIGAVEGWSHAAVREGVLSFVERLPDSWAQVFHIPRKARSLDEHLPIEQLRRAAAGGER
jgi:hypothetical protein